MPPPERSAAELSVRRVAPMLLLAGQVTDVGAYELPPNVIVNCWRNEAVKFCALPVPQMIGSLKVTRTSVETRATALEMDGRVVSEVTVPVTVWALRMTLPARSWIL